MCFHGTTLAVKRKTKFSRATSKRLAKWIWVVIVAVLAGICSPELIFYRTVIDTQTRARWCVLTLNADRYILSMLYYISTILLFLIPLLVNISSGIFIVLGRSNAREQASSKQPKFSTISVNIRVTTIRIRVMSEKRIHSNQKRIHPTQIHFDRPDYIEYSRFTSSRLRLRFRVHQTRSTPLSYSHRLSDRIFTVYCYLVRIYSAFDQLSPSIDGIPQKMEASLCLEFFQICSRTLTPTIFFNG